MLPRPDGDGRHGRGRDAAPARVFRYRLALGRHDVGHAAGTQGRCRTTHARVPASGRNERDRRPGVDGGQRRLALGEDGLCRAGARPALDLRRGQTRDVDRLVPDVVEAVRDQIRRDVQEQHEAGDDEERDDQQCGDDADEDVGQDQLRPDAPQQVAARARRHANQQAAGRDDQRHTAERAGGADQHWLGADREARRQVDRLQRHAGEKGRPPNEWSKASRTADHRPPVRGAADSRCGSAGLAVMRNSRIIQDRWPGSPGAVARRRLVVPHASRPGPARYASLPPTTGSTSASGTSYGWSCLRRASSASTRGRVVLMIIWRSRSCSTASSSDRSTPSRAAG